MANDPQDYAAAFKEDISAMESVAAFDAQGHPSVPGMDYVDTTHPDNPDHVFCHGVANLKADKAIDPKYLRKPDTWRGFITYLRYFNLLGDNGYAPLDSPYGGKFFTSPISTVTFRLAVVSGDTLILYCADPINTAQDPRSCITWNGVARDSIFSAFENISETGCFPGALVGVRFHGTVIEERVLPLMLYPDFSSLPGTVSNSDTFIIKVNQDCTNADLRLDPSIPVTVELIAEYQQPEGYTEIHDQYPVPMVEIQRVYTSSDWGASKIIELQNADNASCLCAFPKLTTGHIWGTFQFEISGNGGTSYSDVTSQIESGNFPRFVISGKRRVNIATNFYLGPITGDSRDFTDGVTNVRIRYMYEAANFSVVGARHPQEEFCQFSQRDYMNWVGDKSTIGAKDIDGEGNHWFCLKHRSLSPEVAENYTWDDCQKGTCPYFQNRVINIVDQGVIAQMTSGQGYVLKQSAAGANTVSDWIWYLLFGAGLMNQLDDPSVYAGNYDAAYSARRRYFSGGYMMVDETDPHYTVDGDIHIKFVRGAIWNTEFDASTLDFNSNRFPAGVFGILPRRIAAIMTALTQFSEEPDGTTDPNYQIRSERLGRKIALGNRDNYYQGTDVSFSARDVPGIEGESRLQRLFTARKFVSGVDKTKAGRQGNTGSDYITVYPTARTIAGVDNVRAVVQIRARGNQNYGHKRIGGAGINGQVWRAEDAGGGLIAIHCAPGLWNATWIDVSGGPGNSVTVDVPFYAGGNVAQITPAQFVPDGAVDNNPNNVLIGGAHGKAVRGDTIEFLNIPALAGMQFLIDNVFPCGGDSFSGTRAGVQVMHVDAVGDFVRFDEFFADGADPSLVITDYETQFTGSIPGTYASVGASQVISVHNSERPYTYPGDPLDTPQLYQDLVISFDESKYADITQIYNGGAGNAYRTVLIIPGHGRQTGEVINLRSSPNSGESDGNHVVERFNENILLSNRINLSPAGEGVTGQWIPVEAGSMVQVGSGRLYASFPVFGRIVANSAVLLGGYNKIRISFDVDGIAQTPKEIQITTPKVQLLYGATAIAIQHVNRITGATEDLVYAGISTDDFDLFLGQSYLTFKYNPDLGRIYFHPLLTGDHVIITYQTSDLVNMDGLGEPGVSQRAWQFVSNRDYLKHCDKLNIQDWNGLLAAASLTDAQFRISTGLASKAVTAVGHSPSGEATWTTLAAENWVHCQPLNQLFLLQAAHDLFPDILNLYLDGTFADHGFKISAEFMQMMLACIGCLDTFGFGLTVIDTQLTVNLSANFDVGFTSITPNSGFESADSVPHGTPGTWGLFDYSLSGANAAHGVASGTSEEGTGGLQRNAAVTATGANHIYQVDAGNYWFGSPAAHGGPVYAIGSGFDGPATVQMKIWEIKVPKWLAKLPAGSTIIDAEIEVYLPPDCLIHKFHDIEYQRWNPAQNNAGGTAYGGLTAPYGTYGDTAGMPEDSFETSMAGGFALIGFDPNKGASGAWEPLGAFQDVSGGDLVAGHWRPIKAVALLEKLRTLKTEKYSKLAIYVVPFAGAITPLAGLDGVGYEDVGILDSIVTGYNKYQASTIADAGGAGLDDYRLETNQYYLQMTNDIAYGRSYVKFKHDPAHLAAIRFQPGPAFPDMRSA